MTSTLIRLRKQGSTTLYQNSHFSLLDALESAYQVSVEFQCRSGYCGVCRLRLLAGKVKYHQEPLAFIDCGDILPCCCLPIGDIELEL